MNLKKISLIAVVGSLIVIPLLFREFPYFIHVIIMVMMFAALAEAWSIIAEIGMLSFGHAAFFGLGAYTSGILLIKCGLNPWIGTLLGGIAGGILGVVIAYPTAKVKGHYFAIASLAVVIIIQILFLNWQFVGAAEGLDLPILEDSLLNFEFHKNKLPYYYIILAILGVIVLAIYGLKKSRFGYYSRAMKYDVDAAESLGIDTQSHRTIATAISAFFTGIVGAFYGQYILYIDPGSTLDFMISVQIVLIAVLGGAEMIAGPLIGAVILIPIGEYSRAWLGSGGKGIDQVIYGLLITLIAVYEPAGIVGIWRKLKRKRQAL